MRLVQTGIKTSVPSIVGMKQLLLQLDIAGCESEKFNINWINACLSFSF